MILRHRDELEAVGPVAANVLRRHGLLWPFNAHFHSPLLDAAAGGSLLTGIGGDEVLGSSRWERVHRLIRGKVRPNLRDVGRLTVALSPARLRAAVLRRRAPEPFPWLTEEGVARQRETWARHAASEPVRRDRHTRWCLSLRYLSVGTTSLEKLAADARAAILHPFLDPGFAFAVASIRPSSGADRRSAVLRDVCGDVLPEIVLTRNTKASFDQAFWGASSRAFAADWDGTGIDAAVVDREGLRHEWAKDVPDPHSLTLLQSLWLRSAPPGQRAQDAATVSSKSSTAAFTEESSRGR